MKALVVYDSAYGNTEKIARAIGGAIAGEVKVLHVGEVNLSELKAIDLLIVGSPTQGFRPTKPVQEFIGSISGDTLRGIDVAAFDTRIPTGEVGRGLRLLMKVGGYAAKRIAEALKKKSANLVVPPEGFFVKDKEGPLSEGELERAAIWAQAMVKRNRIIPI
ncbi:flavodoxin family protein [Chloroflexota bacterium]